MITTRRLGPADTQDAPVFMRRFGHPERELIDELIWLGEARHVLIAAWIGGEPAGMVYGYALPRFDDAPAPHLLYSIDVSEAHRRRGVARALLAAFHAECPGGVWLLTNGSNTAAMALYESAGGTRPHTDDVMFRLPPRP